MIEWCFYIYPFIYLSLNTTTTSHKNYIDVISGVDDDEQQQQLGNEPTTRRTWFGIDRRTNPSSSPTSWSSSSTSTHHRPPQLPPNILQSAHQTATKVYGFQDA